jgi:predicted NBD/HSP70 family sugar kinase
MEKKRSFQREIIKHLYFSTSLSCAELSDLTEKSLPLVAGVLNSLMAEGAVVETGFAPSTGGRRRLMYSLRPDFGYMVTVAMDQFVTRLAILDMTNKPVKAIEKVSLPLNRDPETLILLADHLQRVIRESGIDPDRIVGIGIGMPGFIDIRKGLNYSFFDLTAGSIVEYLNCRLELPVFIDNDSSVIALAESRFGAAKGAGTAMVINIGWGIGLGLILNSELFRGHKGFAGEFSHLPMFVDGKLCNCGKRGCLETEASLLVVLEKVREGLGRGTQSLIRQLPADVEEAVAAVFAAARNGDQLVIGILSEAGYTIGRGAAVLIHLLNPELIILSGRGAYPEALWQTPIQQALHEHCIPRLAAGTSIKLSTLGYDAELIGVASLVMEQYPYLQ